MRTRHGRFVRLVAGGGVMLVVLAGCGAGPTATLPDPTATPPGPTAVPTSIATPPPFACGETLRRPGSVALAHIRGLEAVNENGVGRITITFEPAGNLAAVPEVEIRPAEPPFTLDPSGLPLEVPGTGFVAITLFGGTALDEDFNPTFEGPFDVDPAGGPLMALRRTGDFEAVSGFIAGLEGAPCVRVLPPDGTSRLVIELTTE
jgi:hypothetical protein